ncbi:polysaccharide biosynthesis/export family protein [Mucilaginibacter sp.]|uniref:polysaccharide biosynthesis/export family protein n=1 Tax=Mucilaginibacter sp. TaxID=1882438 RepID=UPI00261DF42C|nr:polysaccharide biosynthesis/export family protein [Mucilaginibacter sp.]MDB4923359.1 polysaccharide export outer membrane protein [Mucilaginibacter sp.]
MTRFFHRSCLISLLIITGCAPQRDLVYFSNMANATVVNDPQKQEVRIKENDIVNVTVNSLSPESNILFSGNKSNSTDGSPKIYGYKVSRTGTIQLPLIGEFKIEGMTIEDAQTSIASELNKNVKNPVVEVQLVNFKITVIGEVNKPSSFIIPDEKVNVLEALGLAGDMTVYGKRENVLIIRNDGTTKLMKRLNLNKLESMNSPYFYLKQNDIVYVEPDRSKAVEYSQNTRLLPLVIASISAVAVLAAVLLKR